MDIPNERELQQIGLKNYHSNYHPCNLRGFTEKNTATKYPFLVTDTALSLDNPLHFRKNLL